MKYFTDSPYEKMMQEIPLPLRPGPVEKAPPGSPCRDCGYWRGMPCVGTCFRDLTAPRKEEGTCGQNVHKCRRE